MSAASVPDVSESENASASSANNTTQKPSATPSRIQPVPEQAVAINIATRYPMRSAT